MSERGPDKDTFDILLVEDNPGDVRLTKEAFKEGRFPNTLHVATDGGEALDFLYQRGEYTDAPRPEIILLDLNLPRKDGDEILDEINTDQDLSRIPVIILSSSDSYEDVVMSYERNANAYLTKPVDPNEFIEIIRTFEEFWLSLARLPSQEG